MKTKHIAIAAIVAALYVVLTLPLGPLATSNFINVRPSEALTLLPLLSPAAIPGLFIGCLISNIPSAFGIWDILFGSMVTLVAAILTKFSRNAWIGGIFPVLLNAIFLPLIFILSGLEEAYWMLFLSILLTQTIWVYGLGIPLYYFCKHKKVFEPKKIQIKRAAFLPLFFYENYSIFLDAVSIRFAAQTL